MTQELPEVVGHIPHPVKDAPGEGVSVSEVFCGNDAIQVPGQLMPAGELVTVPFPVMSTVKVTDGVLPPGQFGSFGFCTVTVAVPTTMFLLPPVSLLLVAITDALPHPAPVGDTTPPATVINCGVSVLHVTSLVISRVDGG
jgi:hypothetical protein